MARRCLMDHQWSLIKPCCLGKKSDPGRRGTDNQMFFEGVEFDAFHIENFFCKLKEFKRIALRACKTDQSFKVMIYLCAAGIDAR
jgi:hypothetical protein